jgi:hypothetical protein
MVNDVVQSIVNRLYELFPSAEGYTVYRDNVPQNSTAPYFLSLITKQTCRKRLNNKYQSTLSFDLSYFSDKAATEIRTDCHRVQEILLLGFDLAGTYRIKNKEAQMIDNVMYVTFDISYSQMRNETEVTMRQVEATTNI